MRIVLGVSGGIAAYKAPELVRRLRDARADVRVVLTPNAARFVSPLALAAVSGHGVITDQWGDAGSGGVDHIELARWAELLLIAPASANLIAKLAAGIADDALTTYAVAHRGPTLIAPAMNTFMYAHPSVGANLATLSGRGVEVIEPDHGILACGDEGLGRMPDVPLIVERATAAFRPRDLEGVRILVTAGPTHEAIDPVRYITNRSSGRMGYAIASAAASRGATVTLVTGPSPLSAPANVATLRITSAADMAECVLNEMGKHDILFMAAAVADFTPAEVAGQKMKKGSSARLTLELKKTVDILEQAGRSPQRPFIVAFAAETDNLEAHAREKLARKNADMIVANDVSDPASGFDVDWNAVTVIPREGEATKLPGAPKLVIANSLLDLVRKHAPRPA